MSTDRVPAVLGTATFGTRGAMSHKVTTVEEAQKFIDTLVKYGHNSVDCARVYGAGSSEELLSQLDLKGTRVDTKIFPVTPDTFTPAKFKEQVGESTRALNGVRIRTLYLHAPDRKIPFEDTLSAVDELYKEGVFESFGLSNFLSYEVAEVVTICRLKGYIAPTVYQGIYNCLDRVNESELFPCLRKYNIRFAAYSPLAGGFLTGFHLNEAQNLDSNTRFNPAWPFSSFYITRYFHSLPILYELKAIGEKHDIPLNEIAVRWLVHHSQLKGSDVGVIYGASKLEQLESALSAHAKGPLPGEIVEALEDAWLRVKAKVPGYSTV